MQKLRLALPNQVSHVEFPRNNWGDGHITVLRKMLDGPAPTQKDDRAELAEASIASRSLRHHAAIKISVRARRLIHVEVFQFDRAERLAGQQLADIER